MKRIRNLILIAWIGIVAVQLSGKEISFSGLKKQFNLPRDARLMIEYYINRKEEAKPISAGGFYVELYKYLARRNLNATQKNNILKAIAYLDVGPADNAVLESTADAIKQELGKLKILVDQQEIDIDSLK